MALSNGSIFILRSKHVEQLLQELQWRAKVLEAQGATGGAAPRSSIRRASQAGQDVVWKKQLPWFRSNL